MSNVSIIIPTLHEEKTIGALLDDINSQTHKPHEIIVVDGKSKDATAQIVTSYPDVRLIRTHANPAHQRHTGAKHASGDLYIFLDADTRMSVDFIEKTIKAFSQQSVSLACPFYIPIENHVPSLILYLLFNGIFFSVQKLLPSGAGSCIIVRKDTYAQLGGFDKRYTYDDMQFLSKATGLHMFSMLSFPIRVSNRRIKRLGFIQSLVLYGRLSRYFIRRDYMGANAVAYPFGHSSS